MVKMSDHQLRRQKTILRFLFPLYPLRVFHSTKLMLLLALLFALRIVFQLITLPIPGFVLNFSFGYLPVMLIGWFFGPIYGMICGALCDTMIYLLFPSGLWFWMYAIQEPIIGLFSGLLASWCVYRQSRKSFNIVFDVCIEQVVNIAFMISCYVILLHWLSGAKNYQTNIYEIYRWFSLGLITTFFIFIEFFALFNFKNSKLNKERNLIFIYALIIVLFNTLVFSFMMGPIATVSYLQYLTGQVPSNWVKFGAIYYLIPRVIVQSIKTPLEIILLTSLIMLIKSSMRHQINTINNGWINYL